jgi:hypothetical protein
MNINISKWFVINIKDDLYNYLCQTRICLILFFLILIYTITQFHMKVVVTTDNISNYPFGKWLLNVKSTVFHLPS